MIDCFPKFFILIGYFPAWPRLNSRRRNPVFGCLVFMLKFPTISTFFSSEKKFIRAVLRPFHKMWPATCLCTITHLFAKYFAKTLQGWGKIVHLSVSSLFEFAIWKKFTGLTGTFSAMVRLWTFLSKKGLWVKRHILCHVGFVTFFPCLQFYLRLFLFNNIFVFIHRYIFCLFVNILTE